MLPDVDADDGGVGYIASSVSIGNTGNGLGQRRTEKRVLVGGGDDLELLCGGVEAEPAPSGALESGRDGVHLRLERYTHHVRVSNIIT